MQTSQFPIQLLLVLTVMSYSVGHCSRAVRGVVVTSWLRFDTASAGDACGGTGVSVETSAAGLGVTAALLLPLPPAAALRRQRAAQHWSVGRVDFVVLFRIAL